MQFVEAVEEGDDMEDPVHEHEQEVIDHDHEKEGLVDLGVSGEAIVFEASSEEIQSQSEIPRNDQEEVDDIIDYGFSL